MPNPVSQPGFSAASRISIGIRRYMCHSMPEFHAGARGLARDPSFHALGFRADCKAGSGTQPGTPSPSRE